MTDRGPDPNKDSTDPMVAEYWQLGEDVQDHIRSAGYEPEGVEGIAVDLHDLLQAAEKIRDELAPAVLGASGHVLADALIALQAEISHMRWHCDAAAEYLEASIETLRT